MKYQYWLSNVKGMTSGKILCMQNEVEGAQEIYGLSDAALRKIKGITAADAEAIIESRKTWNLDEELFKLRERGIGFVCREQKIYPERLNQIRNPPYALYYIGELPDLTRKTVAIVGARDCTNYGAQVAEKLGYALGQQGVNVVSGLARGVDAEAHLGCLRAHGRTYAVLGNGINLCYPTQNRYIYDQIPRMGGIISEYPPDVQPLPGFFPNRNRIIAALCDTVIVAEARLESGSLITADFAMEQGKDVYAVPGRITDMMSGGCNRLIQQGAGIILSVKDFLKEYLMLDYKHPVQMDFNKNLLEKDELMVYSLLDFCPIGLGSLMEMTKLPVDELLNILDSLGQKGFIKEAVPNYFVRTL